MPGWLWRRRCSTVTGMIEAPYWALRSEERSRVARSGWFASGTQTVGARNREPMCSVSTSSSIRGMSGAASRRTVAPRLR